MVVNVIYDNRHTPSDYGRLITEFREQGINEFKFWDAVVLNDSVVNSISESHKMIIRWAKENNVKECCVLEQDATFTSPNSWKYFIEKKPEKFDLYLWGSYITPISNNCICGFQLYIISDNFYESFLSVKKDNHIDTAMDNLNGDYHFCYPFPCLQRVGFSANNKSDVNYNAILKEEDIYKG